MRVYQQDTVDFLCLYVYRQSEGLSGRALRKLPFLAHAMLSQEVWTDRDSLGQG